MTAQESRDGMTPDGQDPNLEAVTADASEAAAADVAAPSDAKTPSDVVTNADGTAFVPTAPVAAPVLTDVAPEGADGTADEGASGASDADGVVASGPVARLRMTWWTLDWRAKAAVAALVVAVIMAVGAVSYGVWRNAALHIITDGPTPLSWRTDAADNDLSSADVFGEEAQEGEEQEQASDASGSAGAKSSGSAASNANGGASSGDASDASGDASDDAGDKPSDEGGADKPSGDLTEDEVQWTGYY